MIKYVMVKQRTDEWYKERLGKITASRFADVMTAPRNKKARESGELSKTAETYLYEKITELMTGVSRDIEGQALDWGTEYEEDARLRYEIDNLIEVEEAGFILSEDWDNVGGSPDGLVGDDGIIEIKCPYNSVIHVQYLLGADIPRRYILQIQGYLWLTGRNWCDFISYDPRMTKEDNQIYIKRINRDEPVIDEIIAAVSNFRTQLENKLIIKALS